MTQQYKHLSGGRKVRKFDGAIEYRESYRLKIPFGRGYRQVNGYSAKGGLTMSKKDCRADAAKRGKRAVFVDRRWDPPPPKPRGERLREMLTPAQLEAVDQIVAKIREAGRTGLATVRARAYESATKVFAEEALLAVCELAECSVGPLDNDRRANAIRSAKRVGAGMLLVDLEFGIGAK